MIVLLGVLVVVVGFGLRFNPLLVVTVAGITPALLGGLSPLHVLEDFGTGFAASRSISIAFIVLPVIGLLERYGLQQRAKTLISQAAALTAGRLLLLYLFIRQLAAALDNVGNIVVSDNTGNHIDIYRPGHNSPFKRISVKSPDRPSFNEA